MVIIRPDRRMFLRLAGGGALALPFLPSLVRSGGARAQDTTRLKRLVVVYGDHSGNGNMRIPDLSKGLFGAGDPSFLVTDVANAMRAGPLPTDIRKAGGLFDIPALTTEADAARLRQELLVVNGLVSLKRDYGHERKWFGLNGDCREERKWGNEKPVPTIDHIIASHLRAGGVPVHLGHGGAKCSVDMGGAPVGSKNLGEAYASFFRGFGQYPTSGTTAPQVDHRKLTGVAMFNLATEQRQALARNPRLSSNDRTTIEAYFDSLRDLELRMTEERRVLAQCADPREQQTQIVPYVWQNEYKSYDDKAKEWVTQKRPGDKDWYFIDVAGWVAYMRAAFLCDISPVVGIFNITGEAPFGMSASAWQDAGYISSDNNRTDDHAFWHDHGADPRFKDFATHQMKIVCRLAQALIDTKDADGEDMLKSSLVIHFHEHAMGAKIYPDNNHQFVDYGYTLFGGSNALRTGRMVDYLDAGRNPVNPTTGVYNVNQFLITIMRAFGVPESKWRRNGRTGYGIGWQPDGADDDGKNPYKGNTVAREVFKLDAQGAPIQGPYGPERRTIVYTLAGYGGDGEADVPGVRK